ncbi:flavin reductase family protein [Amycolatopsis jejuensis]|uniref:flavin reductase family protein n=1 Tax=Amycolatopsis jejuensis TaxID=330084 RepID=UPI00052403A3|nr:flavin reductase family protein [Amycolatopsis jejuensis]
MEELKPFSDDPVEIRATYGYIPAAVVAVCAIVDDKPVGMAASSFTCVSLDPPLVSVCIQTGSTTWPKLRSRPRLGLSVLGEHQHDECVGLSRKTGNRFAAIEWTAVSSGSVLIDGAGLWLECSLYAEMPAGDHQIALLRIHSSLSEPGVEPIVFQTSKFRRLRAA